MDNGIFNRPIMARTQILGGWLADALNQKFSSPAPRVPSVAQAVLILVANSPQNIAILSLTIQFAQRTFLTD